MARHDLLTVLGLESLKDFLASPPSPKWGRIEKGVEERPLVFTRALSEAVLKAFFEHPSFLKSDPVILGSWARGELSPGSDLDVLFLGPEDEVRAVMSWAQGKGLKIRARVPEDPEDLAVGVELWDHMSLLDGRAFTSRAEHVLEREKGRIRNASKLQKKKWIRTLRMERRDRHGRYDSIQNLLEPHLKLGLGGLRDLHQARLMLELFPELQVSARSHHRELFGYYLRCFLWIRLLLHFEGHGDIIAGPFQPNLASRLGFADYHAFMSFVQRGLSRVSFYTDWILEQAGLSPAQRARDEERPYRCARDLSAALLEDPSVRTQYQVRRRIDEFWPESTVDSRRAERGRELRRFVAEAGEKEWIALFRSRLADRLLPELKPLVGFVQHDQYHRYTADAHILQVVRQVLRARRSARHLGPLGAVARDLTAADWNLLLWTALYHDLAKGRPDDHSDLGARWVARDLKAFGLPEGQVKEVQWLVRHHLAFSHAALRRDPQDTQVLQDLSVLDLNPGRIRRLLVFTAIDILGTHPTSWNDWKARLLGNLGNRLLDPERKTRVRLLQGLGGLPSEDQNRFLLVGEEIGMRGLLKDFERVKRGDSAAPFAFFPVRKRLWVRYHRAEDQSGVLAFVLGLFFQAGASVLQSTVMTLPGIGIYDWFCLDFTGRVESLEKRIKLLAGMPAAVPPEVRWESVEIVQVQAESWTLLFRGLDQRGLLWNAANSLFKAGARIKSAQVQTWGQKAEDLIVILPPAEEPAAWLERFKGRVLKG